MWKLCNVWKLISLPCNMGKTHGTRKCLQGFHHTPRVPLEIEFIIAIVIVSVIVIVIIIVVIAIIVIIFIVIMMKMITIMMVTIDGSSMGSLGGLTS